MANYVNNFETIVFHELEINEGTTIKMKLDRHKTKGSLKLHIREFITTPEYTGYTKNGVSISVANGADVEKLQESINTFLNDVKARLG